MSDLSQPPLSLLPVEGERLFALPPQPLAQPLPQPPPQPLPQAQTRAEPERASATFVWPTPKLPCYPAPSERAAGQPCEIEGLNGKTTSGRLMGFDPVLGHMLLAVPQSRAIATLRFDQFRRLRLLRPLAALPLPSPTPTLDGDLDRAEALAVRPAVPFNIVFKGGAVLEGLTMGPTETEHGLYLFEPTDLAGTVRRSFVPRAAFEAALLGQRIGEALIEQHAATPEQVLDALDEQRQLRSQKLGDMMVTRHLITAEELGEAIDQQARMPMVRIGEALTALGFITDAQLASALEQQKVDRNVPLGELLVRKGLVSRQDLQTALARKMGYPLVDVMRFPVDVDAIQRIPYALAGRLAALPLMLHAGRLVVALEDPTKPAVIDELEFAAQSKVVPVLARVGVILGAIDKAYEKLGGIEFLLRMPGDASAGFDFDVDDAGKLLASLEQQQTSEARASDDDEPTIEQSDNSLVRLINSMILEAHAQGVSDIHIETQPGREKLKIRFRKDGQLRPYMDLPHTYRNAMIARLKIMCDLDISERRKPQDGKINFGKFVQGHKLELRVATIPTFGGLEDAVLRLLAAAKPMPLEKLNMSPDNLQRLKAAITRPYGIILCVGPTGSGKTTTLHSALGYINTPDRKIWTAEDPIEITQAGLRQVQVNTKIDWTFAKALRAFLRADPDVVMVGEIRDRETAQMAIEASLTGHLVLSTLHTNSAPETVTRLLDMGMDPFNFADALLAVLAQRLVRRLCTECRTPHEASPEEIDEMLRDQRRAGGDASGTPSDEDVLADWTRRFGNSLGRFTLYRPAGCAKCDETGWRGRAAIHEMMTVSREMKHLIQTGTRAELLQRQGLSEGMRTLRQDGIEKVLAGVTTLDEVRAVSN